MTYNIQSGHGDIDRTAATIRAFSPDIVGLEEVDVHWAERSGFVDQASRLGQSLGMPVRFAHIYEFPGTTVDAGKREFGVAHAHRTHRHVLVSPNGKVDRAFVPVVPNASDHRPVVVDLSFGHN